MTVEPINIRSPWNPVVEYNCWNRPFPGGGSIIFVMMVHPLSESVMSIGLAPLVVVRYNTFGRVEVSVTKKRYEQYVTVTVHMT